MSYKVSDAVKELLDDITKQFPEIGRRMNACATEFGFLAYSSMIEKFSDATTEAMQRQDLKTVKNYLEFMSKKLSRANEEVHQLIDVSYVEPLMFQMKLKEKQELWPVIPLNLRDIYAKMWGDPTHKP